MSIFVRGLAVIAALLTLVPYRAAAGDDYPSRPVTLIAPWPAGGRSTHFAAYSQRT